MLKRIFDFIASLLALILLFPLFIFLYFKVKANLGSPVIFKQVRPGKRGELFKMYKFRTMTDNKNQNGDLLSDEDRITPFGNKLRQYSLDELPELWNVLIGNMSLVGPRPLLPSYLPLYSSEQARRHNVKPGITGWAQVNGRNAISWDEKFKLDCWYVDNHNILLDIKILFLTVKKVFKKEDISSEGHATMPFFEGDEDRND